MRVGWEREARIPVNVTDRESMLAEVFASRKAGLSGSRIGCVLVLICMSPTAWVCLYLELLVW